MSSATRLPFSAALTTAASAVSMAAGALFAVVIAIKFGSTARTDGFFAAFSVYGLAALLGQSWRTTLPARLLESSTRFGAFDRFIGASTLLFAAFSLLFVVLGDPLASLLTGGLPPIAHETARAALLWLFPAVGGQLFAGLAASMLAVLGDYVHAAVAYTAGSVIQLAAFVALEPTFGFNMLPASILLGTAATMLVLARKLVQSGWRPRPSVVPEIRSNARATGTLLVPTVVTVSTQVAMVIAISVASRLGEGVATLYSYVFLAQGTVRVVANMSAPVVLAAPIAAAWDRDPASLRGYADDVLRVGFAILMPCIAAAVILGPELGAALLPKLTEQEIHEIIVGFLIFSVSIAAAQAAVVEGIALFTLARYRAISAVAAFFVVLSAILSVAAGLVGTLAALAAAGSISNAARTAAMLQVLYGVRALPGICAHVLRELLQVALPATVAFGLPVLALGGHSLLANSVVWIIGLGLYTGAMIAFVPPYRQLLTRFRGSVRAG